MRGIDPRRHGQRCPATTTSISCCRRAGPSRCWSIQADGAAAASVVSSRRRSPIGTTPPFKAEVVPASRVTAASFERPVRRRAQRRDALSTADRRPAQRGSSSRAAGCSSVLGDRTPVDGARWPLMPGTLGAPVDRARQSAAARSATSTTAIRSSSSSRIRATATSPTCGSSVTARSRRPRPTIACSRGSTTARAAMVERAGRQRPRHRVHVARWTRAGTTFRRSAMFLPLLHETDAVPRAVRRARGVVHRRPHARHLGADRGDGARGHGGRRAATVAEGDGRGRLARRASRSTLGDGGAPSVELVGAGLLFGAAARAWASGGRSRWRSTSIPPSPICRRCRRRSSSSAATGRAAATPTGQSLERPELTPADIEKKQSIWWFLLVGGHAALLGEAVLANRLSKRLGFGLLQTGKTAWVLRPAEVRFRFHKDRASATSEAEPGRTSDSGTSEPELRS